MYNPLFIYARPGLGKTHLLMGMGHAARAINPRLAVEYLTLDEFVESFHAAIAAGRATPTASGSSTWICSWWTTCSSSPTAARCRRSCSGSPTRCRRPTGRSSSPATGRPAEIEALDERLIRRFAGGLVIDVAAPDYETRVAILRRKAEERRPRSTKACSRRWRARIDNVRELLGALNRLVALQAVSDAPLTPAQARRCSAVRRAAERRSGRSEADRRPGERRAELAARPRPPSRRDEFGDFLSEISATVAQQVDAWRTKSAPRSCAGRAKGSAPGGSRALLQQRDDHAIRSRCCAQFEPTSSGCGRSRRRPRSWRRSWPARPHSAIPATSPGPRRCSAGPRAGPTRRRRRPALAAGRLVEAPAIGWPAGGAGGRGGAGRALQPARHRRRQRGGEDPPAPRPRQRARGKRARPGGVPQRATSSPAS